MGNFILDYLTTYFDEQQPLEFYRSIFPLGELAEKGVLEQGKYNCIAVELLPKEEQQQNVRKHIITDDLERLELLLQSDNFVLLSPISYIGRSRAAENARFIYALAIDLDGITEQQYLIDLFYQMDNGIIPKATSIVYSGTGLHLYYVFEEPLPCFKNIVKQLADLKKELTKSIWNKYTTAEYEKPQIESLFQGFRMVGGITKKGDRTRAFANGDKITIEYLNSFVEDKFKVKEYRYKSKLTLTEAKEKYPEWYQKRVIEKQPAGSWVCKRDLFDWWKSKIMQGAKSGHRYYCIMVLAIYAKKCGIEKQELEEYAFSMVEYLDKLTTDSSNHFTRADILAALEMYNDSYIRFPIDSITTLTAIPIEKNKRNYRKQKDHIEYMNTIRQFKKRMGEIEKLGRPTAEQLVIQWKEQNPKGSKADCIRETGLSKPTVYKHWEKRP